MCMGAGLLVSRAYAANPGRAPLPWEATRSPAGPATHHPEYAPLRTPGNALLAKQSAFPPRARQTVRLARARAEGGKAVTGGGWTQTLPNGGPRSCTSAAARKWTQVQLRRRSMEVVSARRTLPLRRSRAFRPRIIGLRQSLHLTDRYRGTNGGAAGTAAPGGQPPGHGAAAGGQHGAAARVWHLWHEQPRVPPSSTSISPSIINRIVMDSSLTARARRRNRQGPAQGPNLCGRVIRPDHRGVPARRPPRPLLRSPRPAP
jgi:hypothetical protein